MGPRLILVVDDEIGIRETLADTLVEEGYLVETAEDAAGARAFRERKRPDLVLLDIWMPDTDGVTLLKEWAANGQLTMPVVMMSGHGTIDTAVEATRLGAIDFLEKPIPLKKLLSAVSRALSRGGLPPRTLTLDGLGRCKAVTDLKNRLNQIAPFKNPVLLVGERGSGAELCGRFLAPVGAPFIVAGSADLVSQPTELANQAKNGVLFVRNADSLDRLAQRGLAIAANRIEKLNGRLIVSSSQRIHAMVEAGEFSGETYEAIASLVVPVPALREHREDVPDIAAADLTRLIESGEVPVKRFATAALNLLRNFDWPGNLSQLRTVVRSVALTAAGEEITADDVAGILKGFRDQSAPPSEADAPPVAPGFDLDLPLREAREHFERAYFEHLIRRFNGSLARIADFSGMERTHLYRKLKSLGIDRKSGEKEAG